MKYRKKPVVIEAEQYNGDPSDARLFCQEAFAHNGKLIIPTLEGELVCNKGDYIIRGVKGEYYPCKADIFEMTYEPVAEDGENETTVAYFTLCKDNELGDVYKCASCGNEMYGNMPKYCSECGKRIVGKEDAVVRGEWVKSDYYKGWLVCSACHDCCVDNAWMNGKKWRYCPNCGAKMEDKP